MVNVTANSVTIGGKQIFSCIVMSDFLTALAGLQMSPSCSACNLWDSSYTAATTRQTVLHKMSSPQCCLSTNETLPAASSPAVLVQPSLPHSPDGVWVWNWRHRQAEAEREGDAELQAHVHCAGGGANVGGGLSAADQRAVQACPGVKLLFGRTPNVNDKQQKYLITTQCWPPQQLSCEATYCMPVSGGLEVGRCNDGRVLRCRDARRSVASQDHLSLQGMLSSKTALLAETGDSWFNW